MQAAAMKPSGGQCNIQLLFVVPSLREGCDKSTSWQTPGHLSNFGCTPVLHTLHCTALYCTSPYCSGIAGPGLHGGAHKLSSSTTSSSPFRSFDTGCHLDTACFYNPTLCEPCSLRGSHHCSLRDVRRSLMSCAAYSAIVGLESLEACSDGGAGPLLLAPLSPDMKANVLK